MPVTADQPEIQVDSEWGRLLDTTPPRTACTPLGHEGSIYDMTPDTGHPGVMLLTELFTTDECARLIHASESFGYGYTDYNKQYRGNTRLISTDHSLADAVWKRIKKHVPARLRMQSRCDDSDTEWEAVGLNERWRLAKYVPGDRFEMHCDAAYRRNADCMSMFTVNAYMNSDFTGGATRFYQGRSAKTPQLSVAGAPGMCCVFRQPPGARYLHDGEEVTSGVKYLFRTDVMYRRVAPAPAS